MAIRPRKVTAQTVHYMTRAGLGRLTEPVAETWDERQARVTAERAAKKAQREAEAANES